MDLGKIVKQQLGTGPVVRDIPEFIQNEDTAYPASDAGATPRCAPYPRARWCTRFGGLHRFLLVRTGQLRVYILSDEGREVTLYRQFPRDLCVMSASCMLRGLQYDVTVEAEKDTEFWQIPARAYKELMEASAPVANYTNEVMASHFSDVMWLIEQILWKSFDKRLAAFLLEESALEDSPTLKTTHETIGHHLGSPREVVTRMLRYFQDEGLVKLSRGSVTLVDTARLQALAGD